MKKIGRILVITFVASTVLVSLSHAQNFASQDYEEPDPGKWTLEDENVSYSFPWVEPDSSDTKDSLIIKPEPVPPKHVRLKNEQAPAEESKPVQSAHEDDSILSFNFLYYIIQKYKLQDIVD